MAEYVQNNFDNIGEIPSTSGNYSSNLQFEPVSEAGHSSQQQPAQTTGGSGNNSPNLQSEPVSETGHSKQQKPTQTTKLTDDYGLLEVLGKGGYGTVRKAKHLQTELIIAVKIIKKEPGEDYSKLQQEIALMESVSNRNIVAYYGSYLSRNRLSICMEYCAGGSLQKNYRENGPLSELQIVFVCRKALKGLIYLHEQGIIHRDIKGANILLTDRGKVKLADFGVSAQLTETISKRETVIGSSYWMAPEIANVGEKAGYNEKCDIWALGITSIELAECKPPNSSIRPLKLLIMMSKRGFKVPSLKEKDKWSRKFHAFVKVSLRKNPETRPRARVLLKHAFVTQRFPRDIGQGLLNRNNIPN